MLAQATGPDTVVVGLPAQFAIRRAGEWRIVGYHEVTRGGWRPAERVLWWEQPDGQAFEVELEHQGRFPELFKERVTATMLVDRVVGEPGLQVRVTARRDLSDTGEVSWRASPVGGTRADAPGLAAFVQDAIEDLRADYGIG